MLDPPGNLGRPVMRHHPVRYAGRILKLELGQTVKKTTVVALLLFVVLSLVLTHPLSLHLADAVEDWQDGLLNVWITAWDGHQLLTDPLHLFDANIFYPYPGTLAYSELLLGNALLALPITVVSGNPVLGYNLALFLSFVLSAFGTYLLVLNLIRSPGAGIVAGIIFAFCSYRMSNFAQVQLLVTQWMPLALLSLLYLMRRPRPRHVVTFVLFFTLQALSCFYYALLLGLAAAGLVVWLWATDSTTRNRGAVLRLLIAACGVAVLILPFVVPYVRANQNLGFARSLQDAEPFSASLRQYLLVPPNSVFNGRWLPSDDKPQPGGYPVDALFPGLVASSLGVWGLLRSRDRMRWFFLLLLVAAVLLSFGPRLYIAPHQPSSLELTLPYAWLYRFVPGAEALRAPVRFDLLAMLALAVLAGYGAASFRRRFVHALLAGLVLVESLVWPAAHIEPVPLATEIPPVYRWLADQPPGPVLELPMIFMTNGPPLEYQYMSIYHWHPTPDGFSGFFPPRHDQIVFEIRRFPSARSISLIQALDVRYLIIHTDRYPQDHWLQIREGLAENEAFNLVEAFGPDVVYEVQPRSFDPTALSIQTHVPSRAGAGQPITAYVVVTNHGQQSYAIPPTDLLHATVTWESAEAGPSVVVEANLPLVLSPGGGTAVVPLRLEAPAEPGMYRLRIQGRDGTLGEWSGAGMVEVGDQADNSFPVPVRLAAWSVPSTARAGQPLEVNLQWLALDRINAYYSVYVKLLDPAEHQVAGWDGQPRDGEAPTGSWLADQVIDDVVTLRIPADIPPGDYIVAVGMYRAEDLVPALTLNGDGEPVARVVLGTVRVEP
jgi:hypothetical protein